MGSKPFRYSFHQTSNNEPIKLGIGYYSPVDICPLISGFSITLDSEDENSQIFMTTNIATRASSPVHIIVAPSRLLRDAGVQVIDQKEGGQIVPLSMVAEHILQEVTTGLSPVKEIEVCIGLDGFLCLHLVKSLLGKGKRVIVFGCNDQLKKISSSLLKIAPESELLPFLERAKDAKGLTLNVTYSFNGFKDILALLEVEKLKINLKVISKAVNLGKVNKSFDIFEIFIDSYRKANPENSVVSIKHGDLFGEGEPSNSPVSVIAKAASTGANLRLHLEKKRQLFPVSVFVEKIQKSSGQSLGGYVLTDENLACKISKFLSKEITLIPNENPFLVEDILLDSEISEQEFDSHLKTFLGGLEL